MANPREHSRGGSKTPLSTIVLSVVLVGGCVYFGILAEEKISMQDHRTLLTGKQQEMDRVRGQLQARQLETAEQRSKLEKKIQSNTEMSKKNMELVEQRKQLRGEVSELRAAKEANEAKITELQGVLLNIEMDKNALEDENEVLAANLAQAESDYDIKTRLFESKQDDFMQCDQEKIEVAESYKECRASQNKAEEELRNCEERLENVETAAKRGDKFIPAASRAITTNHQDAANKELDEQKVLDAKLNKGEFRDERHVRAQTRPKDDVDDNPDAVNGNRVVADDESPPNPVLADDESSPLLDGGARDRGPIAQYEPKNDFQQNSSADTQDIGISDQDFVPDLNDFVPDLNDFDKDFGSRDSDLEVDEERFDDDDDDIGDIDNHIVIQRPGFVAGDSYSTDSDIEYDEEEELASMDNFVK